MRRSQFFIKIGTIAALSLICVLAVLVFLRQLNLASLTLAELMFQEADNLRVNHSGFDDVMRYVRKFSGEVRSSQPVGECTSADCLATAYVLSPNVLAKYSRLIGLVDRLGIHLFHAHVSFWIKNGTLSAMEKVFFTPKSFGASVFISVATVSFSPQTCKSPSYQLHPGFLTEFRYRSGVPTFEYWRNANLTESTVPEEINMKCVMTFDGCQVISQIMPKAWAQHEADELKTGVYPSEKQEMPCQ